MGADDATLCAGLLHDVLHDTACTKAELEAEFGPDIADLVHETSALNPTDDEGGAAVSASAARPRGAKRALPIKIADRPHHIRPLPDPPAPPTADRAPQTPQFPGPHPRAAHGHA